MWGHRRWAPALAAAGQAVFVTAVVTKPLHYIAVDRDALRTLLFDDGPLSDLILSTFIARREALQRSRQGHAVVPRRGAGPPRREPASRTLRSDH